MSLNTFLGLPLFVRTNFETKSIRNRIKYLEFLNNNSYHHLERYNSTKNDTI